MFRTIWNKAFITLGSSEECEIISFMHLLVRSGATRLSWLGFSSLIFGTFYLTGGIVSLSVNEF